MAESFKRGDRTHWPDSSTSPGRGSRQLRSGELLPFLFTAIQTLSKIDKADHVSPSAVLWAQRSSNADPEKNFIYLTINVPDVPASNIKLDVKPTGLTFTGHSDTLKKTYHVELEFYAEIDPTASKINHTARDVEMKLRKKELTEEYWPRLLKESKKMHFLKTDFDKWVDEDEQNEAEEEDFSQFGGMGE